MVNIRHDRDRMARFLKDPISLPRDKGPKTKADVRIACVDLYQLIPS